MKITFLGVSGALSAKYNSNMLIESNGELMLFDCGEDVMHSLNAAGRKPEELDAVYISHLHFDHCGGLSWLAYYTYFISKKKLKLFIHESLVARVWYSISAAMEFLDGQDRMMTLNDYFDVEVVRGIFPISHRSFFEFGGKKFQLVRNTHVETSSGNMYSYGLLIQELEGCKSVAYISSDTKQANPNDVGINFDILERQDTILFYDCDVMNLSGVHPNYNDLNRLNEIIKKKMWLYHYTNLDDYNGQFGEMPDVEEDGFAGFVQEGQIFEI